MYPRSTPVLIHSIGESEGWRDKDGWREGQGNHGGRGREGEKGEREEGMRDGERGMEVREEKGGG